MDVGPEYVAFEPARRSCRRPWSGAGARRCHRLGGDGRLHELRLVLPTVSWTPGSSSAPVTSKPRSRRMHKLKPLTCTAQIRRHGVTPVTLQMARGTCWVFAAVAVLEHSYRMQGIARGYLDPDQYVRLSEQVFGIAVLDACSELGHNESCLIGDEVWVGNQLMPIDTQGGSPTMLYWLKSLERRAALPHSVCNYTETAGHDHECPGLAARSPTRCASRRARSRPV